VDQPHAVSVIDPVALDGTVLAGGRTEGRRAVLFFRDFVHLNGGHLKVWHYFEHVRASAGHVPVIAFSPRTQWEGNPWSDLRAAGAEALRPLRPDLLFVAGLDWLNVEARVRRRCAIPVINLIQGIRHADPAEPLSAFLSHRAIRICVSQEVADAIVETGLVNGPVHVIPNGTDVADRPLRLPPDRRSWDVMIVGIKAPELGAAVRRRLTADGRRVQLLDALVARPAFLAALEDSRVAVFLPSPREGFYLPAIEAMALGTLVVCPDCVGNRSFCAPDRNCVQPAYTEDAVVEATLATLSAPVERREALLAAGRRTAASHDLSTERAAFLAVLENASSVW
jgi:glycosyltransferase involved in cell wall biosynthesis